jgi:serine phosphatase RsbU (regulator of sigma subunit)
LPEAGAFWREVLAEVSDAVVLQDPEGRLRWYNSAASRLFPKPRNGGWSEPRSSGVGPVIELRREGDVTGHVDCGDRRFPARCRMVQGGWRIWTVTRTEADSAPANGHGIDGFLSEAGARLAGGSDRDRTARLIAELAATGLTDCAVVVLPTTRGRWEWWLHEKNAGAVRGMTRRVPPDAAPVLTRSVAGTNRSAVFSLPREEILALPAVLAEPLGPCARVSTVPLLTQDGAMGALVFGNHDEHPPFGDEHGRALFEFAQRASTALFTAYRFQRQTEAIEGLKTTLGPPELPEVPGARMAVWYEPARGPLDIGGDFYDVHSREDGSALVVLGDICGNGAEAAALTGRVRHSLAALHLVERDGQNLLKRLNEVLIASGSSRFATLVLGSVSVTEDGGVRLTVASGGHPPPLVLRRSGKVEELLLQGMLVGVSPDARFAECSVELAEGDVCVMYTDGITEARGHHDRSKLYGPERLSALLAECADLSAEALLRRVREAVHEWLGNIEHDDMAVLAIQCVPD